VWLSDVPLDSNEGATGAWLVTVELPTDGAELVDREYEWVLEDAEELYPEPVDRPSVRGRGVPSSLTKTSERRR